MAHNFTGGRPLAAFVAGAALFAGSVAALFQVRTIGDGVADLETRVRAGQRRLERSHGTLDRARGLIEQAESAPAPDLDADEIGDLSETMDRTQTALDILEEEALASDRALQERTDVPAAPGVDPAASPALAALPPDQGAAIRAGVRDVLTHDERRKAAARREASVKKAVEQLTDRLALSTEQASGTEALLWAHLEALKTPPGAGLSDADHARLCRQTLRDQIGRLLEDRQAAEFEGMELPRLHP